MATDVVRKCSICGSDMQFVGHIDTDTGKDLKEGFMGEGTMGRFLTGDLRKYECPNRHVETNKNEDVSTTGFQILDENDPFRDAKELVGYAEIHAESERALMRFDHLVCLAYIAGCYNLSMMRIKDVENKKRYLSLHEYPGIVDKAKKGLKTLFPDWLDQLSKQIESQR